MAFYVARTSSLRWAIAGRSKRKLNELRSRLILGRPKPPTTEIGVIVASTSDKEAMNLMARSTRLVLSAVGPYTTLGESTVKACIENGTHYADVTGEVDWVLKMKEKYQERAKQSGSTLCSFAGYDSVPSDISVHAAKSALKAKSLSSAEVVVRLKGGMMPRGTIRTTIEKMPHLIDFVESLVRYTPSDERWTTARSLIIWLLPRWSNEFGAFTVPHFMGWCNIPVVHNSFAGKIGVFNDRMALPMSEWWTGYGFIQTVMIYAVLVVMAPISMLFQMLVVMVPSLSTLILKLFDLLQYRGNTDWSRKVLDRASVSCWTYVSTEYGDKATVHFFCQGDAGIKCTALLAAETAFAMLELDDQDKLPKGIFGSPAMVAGDALVKRLQEEAIDCSLEVTVHKSKKQC